MTLRLAGSGFPFAQVRPRLDRDPVGLTVGVTYIVDEGARTYVERIEVRGNARTRDYVIRREFDLAEGDAFNRVLIDRAERRLRNLGYFSDVRITTEPGSSPDRVVVVVDVVEQPTGEFSFGAGYSTSEGIIGDVALTETQFPRPRLQHARRRRRRRETRATTSSASPTRISSAGASRPASTCSAANTTTTTSAPTTTRRRAAA